MTIIINLFRCKYIMCKFLVFSRETYSKFSSVVIYKMRVVLKKDVFDLTKQKKQPLNSKNDNGSS